MLSFWSKLKGFGIAAALLLPVVLYEIAKSKSYKKQIAAGKKEIALLSAKNRTAKTEGQKEAVKKETVILEARVATIDRNAAERSKRHAGLKKVYLNRGVNANARKK